MPASEEILRRRGRSRLKKYHPRSTIWIACWAIRVALGGTAIARRLRRPTRPVTMLTLHLDAAAIDIGASEIYICVSFNRDSTSIRCFGTFAEVQHTVAEWLRHCGITTVAMEAIGIYWIPLYQILKTRGFTLLMAMRVKMPVPIVQPGWP